MFLAAKIFNRDLLCVVWYFTTNFHWLEWIWSAKKISDALCKFAHYLLNSWIIYHPLHHTYLDRMACSTITLLGDCTSYDQSNTDSIINCSIRRFWRKVGSVDFLWTYLPMARSYCIQKLSTVDTTEIIDMTKYETHNTTHKITSFY